MNGRVFDPLIARFMSADPTIPAPYSLQGYNRFSYTYNNPIAYTDADGFKPIWACIEDSAKLSTGVTFGSKQCQSLDDGTLTLDDVANFIDGLNSFGGGKAASIQKGGSGGPGVVKEATSIGLDLLPIIGSGKSAWQLVTGKDAVTGEKVSRPLEALGLILGMVPGGKLLTRGEKAVELAAKELGKAGGLVFKSSHYAPRLELAGVDLARAESAVAKEVNELRGNLATNADVVRRLEVDGVLIEFRVRLLENGTLNVGTIFPVK